MKLILYLIFLFGSTFLAGLAYSQTIEFYYSSNSNIKPNLGIVHEGECKPKPNIKEVYRVDSTTQQVLYTTYSIDDGSLLGKPSILNHCKVIDLKNWECGGDSLPVRNGLTLVWATRTVSNGKMFYTPEYHLKNMEKKYIDQNLKICYFEKSLFGYKKLPPFIPF